MNTKTASHFAAALMVLCSGYSIVRAEEAIEELSRARDAFEKEMAFSTRPIRERYLSRLESLKRSLGSRGDARTAAAVQDEIDRINAMHPDPAGIAKFTGVWAITYSNGSTRRYSISADGTVAWDEGGGKPMTPAVKAKMTLKRGDFVIDWGAEGPIERLKLSAKNLNIELFSPKPTYPAGQPYARGVGVIAPGH